MASLRRARGRRILLLGMFFLVLGSDQRATGWNSNHRNKKSNIITINDVEIILALAYHPKRGTIVTADFDQGFRKPEMVKRRLCVVMSPPIQARVGLCTIVPLSTSVPDPTQGYHYRLDVPFPLPEPWGNIPRWVKGDMICAVGLYRLDLLRLGKDLNGKRIYQMGKLSDTHMKAISNCVLYGLGLPPLT